MTPRTTPSDKELVRRIRDGEGEAAASLRARHWSSVFDFALRMTASVATAREISDAVFDRLVEHPPPNDESFLAWALTAAHRRVMAQSERVPTSSNELHDDVEIVVDLRDGGEPIDETLAVHVWDAMTRLDRQTQAVIDLHLRQGLDPSQLAPMLGISARDAAETVQQMKRTAAETIAVELLRTDDDHQCAELDATTSDDEARRHITDCTVCGARRTERYSPLQILGALRIVPAGPIELPVAEPAPAPEPAPLRRGLATPLGVFAMLAGAAAIALVGVLAWNQIFGPGAGEPGDQVSPPTTVATTVPPSGTSLPPVALVARPDVAEVSEDETVEIDVLANDNATGASVMIVTEPANGSASIVSGRIVYQPDADYNGPDSFEYAVVGGDDTEASALVTVTVLAVDDAPVAVAAEAAVGVEDEPLMVQLADWVSDVDGDTLTVVSFDEESANGGAVTPALVYTPAPNFNGEDSFGIVVSDGTTELALPVVIDVTPVNDAPVGPRTLSLATDEDVAVTFDALEEWTDVDDDELVFILGETATAAGTLDVAGRQVTYTPSPEFSGEDQLTYRVSDGTELIDVTVDITVAAVADPPTVTRSVFTVDEDVAVGTRIGTLAATDPEGDAFSFELREAPDQITLSSSGRIDLRRSLDHEAAARVTVPAAVVDATGARRNFSIVIHVGDVDEAPAGQDQQLLVPPFAAKGTEIGAVAATDPEGGALVFTELNGDPSDAVTITKSGVVRTARQADPILYPITVTVEAKDPGGQAITMLVVLRIDDFDPPDVGAVQVSRDVVWEQAAGGGACPLGPSRSDIQVSVFDSSGIASATMEWSAVFDGVPLSGSTRMAVGGGVATGSFTFGAGLVEPGGESLLTASILVVDRAGNRSTSDSFTITVRSCS